MAEARTDEEEENMRETREQVVRRQPNSSGGRPDRRKPEHRHSQGPLSSIRAAIKRTSTRSTSLSEAPRERERDRRRPEITILSAEPLASTSWFPGASAGFPPPPPPAAQIWGPTIPPSIQPPPSYEEVIREKTQEQVLLPPSSSSSSSSSSSRHPVSTTTIATQTDPGSAPEPRGSQVKRPVRPPRPSVSYTPKPSHVDDITSPPSQSSLISSCDRAGPNTHSAGVTHATHSSTHTQCCDLLADIFSPLTSASGAQTDQWDQTVAAVTVATSSDTSTGAPLERPRPRPRSRPRPQPDSTEVKVQTLVKLREDGLATLAARKGSDITNQEVSQGKYLQELLEAFSSDDWGFPDHRSDGSGLSQSEGEEGDEDQEEEVEEEDMATLKARIQAFEQQQQVADGSYGNGTCGDRGSVEEAAFAKRPEPRPRPRLQGQPAKPAPPAVAPKPKTFSPNIKPSSKGFWEDGALTAADSGGVDAPKTTETPTADVDPAEPAPSCSPKPAPVLAPQAPKTTEKPAVISPKPLCPVETHPAAPAPVPAPRPPPPKHSSCPGDTNPKPPPRPAVAPRAGTSTPTQDRSSAAGSAGPTLPPRPSTEGGNSGASSSGAEPQTETQTSTVKPGSARPGLPTKPPALTSPRRASAPAVASKPTGPSATPTNPDPAPVPPKPPAPAAASKPAPGPAPGPAPAPGLKPPAPALRKGPPAQTKADTTSTANPNPSDPPLPPRPSGVKLLPLRPPPIKSIPGRPPPPAVSTTSSSPANQAPPPTKTSPSPSPSPANQVPLPSKTTTPPANQKQAQKVQKRGPPLPPRPKPGHPLYSSYVKQEVLVVLDDPSPAPSENLLGEGRGQTVVTPLIDQSQCLLDLDIQPEPVPDLDSQSKRSLEGLDLSESQSILPVQPAEQKEQPEPAAVSGPRCVAKFDYEGEEEDELTFSQGDVIALLELIGQEWGRGQIHGRIGIFPLSFADVVEPLPPPPPSSSPGETAKVAPTQTADPAAVETPAPKPSQDQDSVAEEWAMALFDFPGQTAEDLSFQKGALIRVTQHVDAEWRRGRLEGREGLYPAAFTQPWDAQPISGQQPAVKGVAKALFDFTAESEDELSLKVGDTITEVEPVDEQWIMGVIGGKRGIVPKNYISLI